jgi:hypothetical protein
MSTSGLKFTQPGNTLMIDFVRGKIRSKKEKRNPKKKKQKWGGETKGPERYPGARSSI